MIYAYPLWASLDLQWPVLNRFVLYMHSGKWTFIERDIGGGSLLVCSVFSSWKLNVTGLLRAELCLKTTEPSHLFDLNVQADDFTDYF